MILGWQLSHYREVWEKTKGDSALNFSDPSEPCRIMGIIFGAVPGIGEDIDGWISYGSVKKSSEHPEEFGKRAVESVIPTERATITPVSTKR